MVKFKINIKDKKFKNKMSRLIRQSQDSEATLRAIAEQARGDMEKHFDDEKDSRGQSWQELSDVTRLFRRKGTGSVKILQDTGEGSRMNIEIKNKTTARVGSAKDYMEKQNEGGNQKFFKTTVNLPKREWAYISEEGKKRIKLAIKALWVKIIRKGAS